MSQCTYCPLINKEYGVLARTSAALSEMDPIIIGPRLVRSNILSLENERVRIKPSTLNVCSSALELESHSLTVLSSDANANSSPSLATV